MDNPNTNIFQGAPLTLDNPQSKEEDEEIEEQKRRQEELEDLLSDGIHAFKYDDSTVNSSTNVSFDGGEPGTNLNYKFDSSRNSISNRSALEEITQNYRDANPNDQLKILYEVRMREINSLRDEFSKYQVEKVKEINVLKNKVTLSEAEIRHLQLSLTNLESLLVEKTDVINKYKQNLSVKDSEIETLKKTVDQLKVEICSYSSTVNELQLKQLESNPFNVGARNFKSDELQKAHCDQVEKLETLVEEQSRKLQILDQEKCRLEEDFRNLVKKKSETDQENNLTIIGLSKKLQSTQQQCKDLFTLGEAIKRESDHFKERLKQMEANKTDSSFNISHSKPMDNDILMVHLEKLKRMLLDKDIEMRTVQAKLRFYETDMNELFEFRELVNNMQIDGMSSCNVEQHEIQFVSMQKQLQDCHKALTERNEEIKTLHLINKESREKIEEMLQQTRTDIQNLSTRYSLPQLEKMSNDLREAERTIEELRNQLEENKVQRNSSDKENFDEILAMVKKDLKRSENEIKSLQELVDESKKSELQLRDENEKLEAKLKQVCLKLNKSQLESDPDEFKSLKSEYGQVKEQLKLVMKQLELQQSGNERNCLVIVGKLRKKIEKFQELLRDSQVEKAAIEESLQEWKEILSDFLNVSKNCQQLENELDLTEKLEELTNAKTMLEGEKFALEYQLKTRLDELEVAKRNVADLESKNKELTNKINDLEKIYREQTDRENYLKIIESDKVALEQQLRETQKELSETRQETIDLQKKIDENRDKTVRKKLYEQLKETEHEVDAVSSSETFQKILQAELLKSELVLRENLQVETLKRIQDIEAKYKKVLKQTSEVYTKEIDKLKAQDDTYRKQLSAVLAECGQKVMALEDENAELRKQGLDVVKDFEVYRKNISVQLVKYKEMTDQAKDNLEVVNRKWENLMGDCIVTYGDVEKKCHKRMKSITNKINRSKREMELIEKDYSERMGEFKSKHKYKY